MTRRGRTSRKDQRKKQERFLTEEQARKALQRNAQRIDDTDKGTPSGRWTTKHGRWTKEG